MEPEALTEREHGRRIDGQKTARRLIAGILVGDDSVQAVIAAIESKQYEASLTGRAVARFACRSAEKLVPGAGTKRGTEDPGGTHAPGQCQKAPSAQAGGASSGRPFGYLDSEVLCD
jgi:hypothetical protein